MCILYLSTCDVSNQMFTKKIKAIQHGFLFGYSTCIVYNNASMYTEMLHLTLHVLPGAKNIYINLNFPQMKYFMEYIMNTELHCQIYRENCENVKRYTNSDSCRKIIKKLWQRGSQNQQQQYN